MKCWSCGGGIPDGSNFCGLCGARQNPTDRITRSDWARAALVHPGFRPEAIAAQRLGPPPVVPGAGDPPAEPDRVTEINPALLAEPAPEATPAAPTTAPVGRPRFAALAAAEVPGGGPRLATHDNVPVWVAPESAPDATPDALPVAPKTRATESPLAEAPPSRLDEPLDELLVDPETSQAESVAPTAEAPHWASAPPGAVDSPAPPRAEDNRPPDRHGGGGRGALVAGVVAVAVLAWWLFR